MSGQVLEEFVARVGEFPYLASPAALMRCWLGKRWSMPAHLLYADGLLIEMLFSGGGDFMMVNCPPQHGKTHLFCRGYTAWRLLHDPGMRVMVVSHSEEYAVNQVGTVVKEIVEVFGKDLGIKLRKDSTAKGAWVIDGHGGGVLCRGWQGGVTGWPAELIVVDDLIANEGDAMSGVTLDQHWSFFDALTSGRMRNVTSLVLVGTRWNRRDVFGRALAETGRGGPSWKRIVFRAICEEGDVEGATGRDVLGRRPGEALWPEAMNLDNLARKKRGRWWGANFQQEPASEEGSYLRPGRWPRWSEVEGFGYWLARGELRRRVSYDDVLRFIVVDWAATDKRKSDRTAMLVCGLTADGQVLVLDCLNRRMRAEEAVPALAGMCRVWRPGVVGVEQMGFQEFAALECRRWPEIPEPRRLKPGIQNKVARAQMAMTLGENGRIWLPERAAWLEDFERQVGSFTGVDDEADDVVDCLAYAALLAQSMRGPGASCGEPEVLTPAPQRYPSLPYWGVGG